MRAVHLNGFYGLVLTGTIFVFHRHQRIKHTKNQKELCFFFEQLSNETYPLPSVYNFRLDQKALRCAYLLNNWNLHAKLQQGDTNAQDAIYHDSCFTEL